jgi:hypothetical protein
MSASLGQSSVRLSGRILFLSLTALWIGAVVAGFMVLRRFDDTPGAEASSPARWPAATSIAVDPELPTLLVFAHPRCPCTSATIEDLNRLLSRVADRVRTVVVFYSDPSLGADWVHSATYAAAVDIPGISVVEDDGGATARLFGVRTSGQALLYDRDGRLSFAGGITPGRGEPGDNDGSRSLHTLLAGGTAPPSTPVYGCRLLSPLETGP